MKSYDLLGLFISIFNSQFGKLEIMNTLPIYKYLVLIFDVH